MVQKVDFLNIVVEPENTWLYYLNFEAEKQLFLESLLEYTECFACARERHMFIVNSVHFLASIVKFIYKNV